MASDEVCEWESPLLGPRDRIRWPRAIRHLCPLLFSCLARVSHSPFRQSLYLQAETFSQLLLVGATINHQCLLCLYSCVRRHNTQHNTHLASVAFLCSNWKLIDLYNALIRSSSCCLVSACHTVAVDCVRGGPTFRQSALTEVLMIGTAFSATCALIWLQFILKCCNK